MAERTVTVKLEALLKLKEDILTVEKCTQMNIQTGFLDLENPDKTQSDASPLFFDPLSEKLLEQFPVDMVATHQSIKCLPNGFLDIRDYEDVMKLSGEDAKFATPSARVSDLYLVLWRHIDSIYRKDITGARTSLARLAPEWTAVDYDHPLSSACNLRTIGFHAPMHRTRDVFHIDDGNQTPHLILCIEHYSEQPLPTSCLMKSELIFILRAMQIRYNQKIWEENQPQPILLLSFMVPQHARVIQAHISDGKRLVLAISKLYSFERNADAPFELFSRWILARPIGMDSLIPGAFPE